MNAPHTRTDFEGCRLFQVQLPRKALDIAKQKYGNVGALIRGLLAEELGADWPADELYIQGPTNRIHDTQLKVVTPRRFGQAGAPIKTPAAAPKKPEKNRDDLDDNFYNDRPVQNPVYYRSRKKSSIK